MAQDEAKVRVRLDTTQAKSELEGLGKDGQAATTRIGAGVRRAVRGGIRAVGLGGAIGAGMQAVRGATESGIGDVMGEVFGGWGADLEAWALGDLAPRARADRAAREETKAAFGMVLGARGADAPVTPEIANYFKSIQSFRLQEEQGKQKIETFGEFRSVGFDDIIKRIGTLIGEELRGAVDSLISQLKGILW